MSLTTYEDFLQLSIKQLTVIVPVSARSYKIGVRKNWLFGCLVGWLVMHFSQKRLSGFF